MRFGFYNFSNTINLIEIRCLYFSLDIILKQLGVPRRHRMKPKVKDEMNLTSGNKVCTKLHA